MKMGAIRSPWRYDAGPCHAPRSARLRYPAILHYASWAGVFRMSRAGGPVILR